MVQLLLTKGADIRAKKNDDWTALMFATANDQKEIIELLKKAGAKE
jgi:ankyrin repeat protein